MKVESRHVNVFEHLRGSTEAWDVVFFVLSDVSNGGPKEMVFAPNVGMIQYSDWMDGGYDPYFLTQGVLGGRRYGLVNEQTLESGSYSRYPTTGRNQVFLII